MNEFHDNMNLKEIQRFPGPSILSIKISNCVGVCNIKKNVRSLLQQSELCTKHMTRYDDLRQNQTQFHLNFTAAKSVLKTFIKC